VQVFEAICKFGACCWGLSKVTSSEAASEALSRLVSNPLIHLNSD